MTAINMKSVSLAQRMKHPRFTDVFPGMLLSCVLFVAGIGLLWKYEVNSLYTLVTVEESLFSTVELSQINIVYPENNNRLVHATGYLKINEKPFDPQFGMSKSCAKLKRIVELYQWIEVIEEKEVEDARGVHKVLEYSYKKGWRSTLQTITNIDERKSHSNPKLFPSETKEFLADDISLGVFTLSDHLVEQITNFHTFKFKDVTDEMTLFAQTLGKKAVIEDDWVYFYNKPKDDPEIGDIRVKFKAAGLTASEDVAQPDTFSVVAQQAGAAFYAYRSKQVGGDIEFLQEGVLTARTLILGAHNFSHAKYWLTRIFCLILVAGGVRLMSLFANALRPRLPIALKSLASLPEGPAFAGYVGVIVVCFAAALCRLVYFGYRFHAQSAILLTLCVPFALLTRKEMKKKICVQ